MDKQNLAALIIFGVIFALSMLIWISGKIEEKKYYANPSDFKFKINRRGRWVNPPCNCNNCKEFGYMEYWWELNGWCRRGTGKNRKTHAAYKNGESRHKSWEKAIKCARAMSQRPNDSFWRGYS